MRLGFSRLFHQPTPIIPREALRWQAAFCSICPYFSGSFKVGALPLSPTAIPPTTNVIKTCPLIP